MANKMKLWRRLASAVKKAVVKAGMHEMGKRYGRSVRVPPAPRQWQGGGQSLCAPSPLLSGLLKRQGSL